MTTPLNNEQVEKLRDVVMKREWFDTVVECLADHADEAWAQYERSVRDALRAHVFGLGVRNRLRGAGYGEGFFRIANLDDICVELPRRALANPE